MNWLRRIFGVVSGAPWLMMYTERIREGNTAQEAILAVLNFLRRRKPFSALSEDEAKAASMILCKLPDPALFIQVCVQVEQTRDISHLSYFPSLIEFVNYCKEKQNHKNPSL